MLLFGTLATARTASKHSSSSFGLALMFASLFPLAVTAAGGYFEDNDEEFDFDKFGNEDLNLVDHDVNEGKDVAVDSVNIDVKSILENNHVYDKDKAHEKAFTKPSLAYITPWNNRGYDIAKFFRGKFTLLSPVWYQIKPVRSLPGSYVLTGDHDVDMGWIKEVTQPVKRQDGSKLKPKMVPRFMVTDLIREDLEGLIQKKEHYKSVADIIIKECKKRKHDGFVLEFMYSGYTPQFIEYLSSKSKAVNLEFILVIAPQHGDTILFDKPQFDLYKKLVDGFSLMTYDFSNPQTPGPNAPLGWVKDNILRLSPEHVPEDRAKLLVGINLYGNDYSSGNHDSVLGKRYLELLEEYSPDAIAWNSHSKEAVFKYIDGNGIFHQVWYPTIESIQKRVELFENLGTGISMWEIGQGLDYFYELL
ncbi:UNVERIFIED_CONTAM: Chitinase domain-containing protein 1 [Siphonaria sp. JEL0065]|nr:Chitinase domain-containing protein 1 [Siphonaria sp. JEL0065]